MPRTTAGRALADHIAFVGNLDGKTPSERVEDVEAEAAALDVEQCPVVDMGGDERCGQPKDHDLPHIFAWHRCVGPALDVDALAEALMTTVGTVGWMRSTPSDPAMEWLVNAEAVAAAYAAAVARRSA